MKYNLYALFVIITAVCCENSDLLTSFPVCVQDLINVIKTEPDRIPTATVWEWETDADFYYYATSDHCDQLHYLYTTACELIHAQSGRIAESSVGLYPEFESAISKVLVLEETRN